MDPLRRTPRGSGTYVASWPPRGQGPWAGRNGGRAHVQAGALDADVPYPAQVDVDGVGEAAVRKQEPARCARHSATLHAALGPQLDEEGVPARARAVQRRVRRVRDLLHEATERW